MPYAICAGRARQQECDNDDTPRMLDAKIDYPDNERAHVLARVYSLPPTLLPTLDARQMCGAMDLRQ
jgi:hypothetical protein